MSFIKASSVCSEPSFLGAERCSHAARRCCTFSPVLKSKQFQKQIIINTTHIFTSQHIAYGGNSKCCMYTSCQIFKSDHESLRCQQIFHLSVFNQNGTKQEDAILHAHAQTRSTCVRAEMVSTYSRRAADTLAHNDIMHRKYLKPVRR